jgi:hypothetical protein
MIINFKIFENIEDDYYTVLIKLEEISKKLKMASFSRIIIDDTKENDSITFTHIKRSWAASKFNWDPISKQYVEDEEERNKSLIYREKVKIDIKDLTMTWLEVNDKLGPEDFRLEFYYAPDKLKFDSVDEMIYRLELRYLKGDLEWMGKPRKHPLGRRKFFWDDKPKMTISKNDPYGEEEWEYEYPYEEEY